MKHRISRLGPTIAGLRLSLGFLLVGFGGGGCVHTVPLKGDAKWHTLFSLQTPGRSVEIDVELATADREGCDPNRIPETTEIRIVQLESFQKLDELPNTLEGAGPRRDGIPLAQADSGPSDLTLVGAKRVVPLITGKQLLIRSSDKCAAVKLRRTAKAFAPGPVPAPSPTP
jgi:hypothetical protein